MSKIAQDVAKFLEDGGKIQQLEYDAGPENAAKVGRWIPKGLDVAIPDEHDPDLYYEGMDWSDYHTVDFEDRLDKW